MHGWIILDKPVGPGSTQAVSAVKRALRAGEYGKWKVGHGGTLDPLASGVLPIAIGEATKLAGRMLDSDKVYAFTVTFGVETDTLDAEGQVVATSDVRPRMAAIEAVLPRFTGPIDQVPPAFSALKVAGERAYDLARAGEKVTLASRAVVIHSLTSSSPARECRVGLPPAIQARAGGTGDPTLWRGDAVTEGAVGEPLAHRLPPPPTASGRHFPLAGEELSCITLTAHVSKGTYIRSLARDIAHALGTIGHVTMLRRIKAGPFTLESAISLDKLAELGHARGLEHVLLPLRAGLDDIPALSLTPDQAGLLRQGRVLIGIAANDGQHFALLGDIPVALVEVQDREVRVVRGFNL